jgi:hypothetical protein
MENFLNYFFIRAQGFFRISSIYIFHLCIMHIFIILILLIKCQNQRVLGPVIDQDFHFSGSYSKECEKK